MFLVVLVQTYANEMRPELTFVALNHSLTSICLVAATTEPQLVHEEEEFLQVHLSLSNCHGGTYVHELHLIPQSSPSQSSLASIPSLVFGVLFSVAY